MACAFEVFDRLECAGGAGGVVGLALAGADAHDELALPLELGDLLLRLPVEVVEQAIGLTAALVALGALGVEVLKHRTDLLERETERGNLTDAKEAQEVRGLVVTIAVIAARRLGQQADGVIVPQGADAHAGHACKLAAFHLRSSVGSFGSGSSCVVPTDSKNPDVTYESKHPQMLHARRRKKGSGRKSRMCDLNPPQSHRDGMKVTNGTRSS